MQTVEEKDFKRLTMCLQITMTAGDGEILAAIHQANKILERNGLRWDEWLLNLKSIKVNQNKHASNPDNPFTPEGFRRQREEMRRKTEEADRADNPSWTLNREDALWVRDVCERAMKSSQIQGNAKKFVGDMLGTVKLFPDRTIISQKQWNWLQSIEVTLQRARRAG